nr:hypothetical protein B0A51_05330 [Rachicladosporium sp. CCFEE 5018]
MASAPSVTSAGRSETDEKFFMTVCGLPRECDWKGLKDLVRKHASHGVWVDLPRAQGGAAVGWIKGIHRAEEALRIFGGLYRELGENNSQIHLYKEGAHNRPLRCTCSADFRTCRLASARQAAELLRTPPNAPVGVASPSGWSQPSVNFQDRSRYPPTPDTSPSSADVDSLADGITALQVSPQRAVIVRLCRVAYGPDEAMAATAKQRLAELIQNAAPSAQECIRSIVLQTRQAIQSRSTAQPTPVYMATPRGTLVNASQGVVRIEQRGIFVSGIAFSASTREVKDFFSHAGTITRCELQKDARTGRSKGRATVHYTSSVDAAKAITMYDGRNFKDLRLSVRGDRDSVPVSMVAQRNGCSDASSSNAASSALRARSNGTSLSRSDSNAGPIIANGSTSTRA